MSSHVFHTMNMRAFGLPFLAALLCFAQGAFSQTQRDGAAAVLTVARVDPPYKFTVENRGGPLDLLGVAGYVTTKSIEKTRLKELADTLAGARFDIREEFESKLLKSLTARGFVLAPPDALKMDKDDPSAIDFLGSTGASDYVLVARLEEVGLYSGRLTSQFEPKVNVSFELTERKTERSVYSTWFHYGADARKNAEDQILADPRFRFASYGEAIERKDDYVASLREGISKIADMAAVQISHSMQRK